MQPSVRTSNGGSEKPESKLSKELLPVGTLLLTVLLSPSSGCSSGAERNAWGSCRRCGALAPSPDSMVVLVAEAVAVAVAATVAQLLLAGGSCFSGSWDCKLCSGDILPTWKGGWNTLTEYLARGGGEETERGER